MHDPHLGALAQFAWTTMDDLVTRWQDFQAKPFPRECAGREIQGIDLVALDTFTAGCISTYIERKGQLDTQRRTILQTCIQDLQTVTAQLQGVDQAYFVQLLGLASECCTP
jgi:hypothetical protein